MYDDLYKLLACFNATLFIDGNQLEITDHGRASGTDMHSGAAEPGSKGQMGWLDPSRREKETKSIFIHFHLKTSHIVLLPTTLSWVMNMACEVYDRRIYTR
jgi:hypothetical protein